MADDLFDRGSNRTDVSGDVKETFADKWAQLFNESGTRNPDACVAPDHWGMSADDSDTAIIAIRLGAAVLIFLLFLWWQFKSKKALPPRRFIAPLESTSE